MRTLLAALATAGFVAMAAFELHHDLIAREPWPGYALVGNNVVFLVVPPWLIAAALLWVRRDWAWVGILAGVIATLTHGVGVSLGGGRMGVVFIAAAPALLLLSWHARPPSPAEALAGDEARERAAAAHR